MNAPVLRPGIILLSCVLLGALVSPPSVALAASDPTSGCLGHQDASPGRYGVLIVDCAPGFATAHDRLYVYPRGPIATGQDWRADLNTTDAVWIFDVGARREASLIIDFHPNPGGPGLEADLYDDRDGDGNVLYQLADGIPVPAEAKFPTVRVLAPDGWWTKDGKVNFNLNVYVDGPVYAAFGSSTYLQRLKVDGRPDYVVRVRDPDHDGRPDFEWIDAWPDAPVDWGIIRSQLMVSTNHDERAIGNYLFWPYLGTSYGPAQGLSTVGPARFALVPNPDASYGFVKDYGKSFPPIQVWWPGADIAYVGEFVASRGNGSNWFVYSLNRLDPSHLDRSPGGLADFENPFAFYDLARAHDGYPDLAIRQEYYPAHDAFFDGGAFDQPSELIRYSWDQFHAHAWNYKLDLLGRRPITDVVTIGPLSVATVPYSQYPTWITAQRWDLADFVAVDSGPWTSEGVYQEVLDTTALWRSYLTGVASEAPAPRLETLPRGYRGEFTLSLGNQPYLYFSPIDHQLHLVGATAGIWNLDDRTKVRYENLGGKYLDKWTLVENGSEVGSLAFVSGQLLLMDRTGLRIKAVDSPPASFTTLPPTTHDTWARLGALLLRSAPRFAGDDLRAMFDQFPGSVQSLPGATTKDLRVTAAGFRLVVHLPAGTAPTAPWAMRRPPGDYLVRYDRSTGFSAEPLEPAILDLSPVELDVDRPTAFQPVDLTVTLRNRGNEDANGVRVHFMASSSGVENVTVGTTGVDVPGGGLAQARVGWAPPASGDWTVWAVASVPFAPATATRVSVSPPPGTGLPQLLAVEQLGERNEIVVGLVMAIALLVAAGLALGVLLVHPVASRSRRSEVESD